jgi:hypothetical protein
VLFFVDALFAYFEAGQGQSFGAKSNVEGVAVSSGISIVPLTKSHISWYFVFIWEGGLYGEFRKVDRHDFLATLAAFVESDWLSRVLSSCTKAASGVVTVVVAVIVVP